jgi:transcriptional regulator with XRE-family HTH domain
MIFPMSLGTNIQAWRVSRGYSGAILARKADISEDTLASIESDAFDVPVSILPALAGALGIPASWLWSDPRHLALLMEGAEEDLNTDSTKPVDPVMEQVLRSANIEPEMYVLLTAIVQSGEPKLVRAAQASLRSLAKQAKQPTVPWESRPSGHFEPPSD